ncbi:MAG: MFS transporter [Nocardioides sp.]|uniref:MFS transporter n=1 Tax=Nocardioides sp. TaxID=35761 RepID=UPI0039E4AA38
MSQPEPVSQPAPGAPKHLHSITAVVGFLVAVEIASGILQGFYTPIWKDIAHHLSMHDADVNWFEAAQLIVSALAIPLLARLGDLIGHKRVLLLSTAITAVGSWILAFAPSFTAFLIGFAIQGAYVVWLPMEVAIVHRRTAADPRQDRLTRTAAGVLVFALEIAVIIGAGLSGALVGGLAMSTLLMIPAVAVSIAFFVIWFGVEDRPGQSGGGVDWTGLGLITLCLVLVMGGLILIRLNGPGFLVAWLVIVLGLAAMVPFVRFEAAHDDPIIDVHLFAKPAMWPVQLTAFLFGMSVLGAQIPLSTFARTDPDKAGFGLGASAGFVTVLIVVYVVTLAVGALTLPFTSRLLGPRGALLAASLLVAIGYALWIPFHDHTWQALLNMAIAGFGSGALVAALPASAAAAAPPERTGFATGMTNGTKTVGGAIASAIFAIALSSTGSLADTKAGHAPLSGYLTVWAVCSVAALLAAASLLVVPRGAFADPAEAPLTTP